MQIGTPEDVVLVGVPAYAVCKVLGFKCGAASETFRKWLEAHDVTPGPFIDFDQARSMVKTWCPRYEQAEAISYMIEQQRIFNSARLRGMSVVAPLLKEGVV